MGASEPSRIDVRDLDLSRIETVFRPRDPVRISPEPGSRAAVALVLAPDGDDLRVLFIKRAEHPQDPWSGHMAFPGGRHDPEDRDLVATAVRETAEEVGIDLARHGRLVSGLDEVQAHSQGKAVDLVITPHLFFVDEPHEVSIDESEVAAAIWLPLEAFGDPDRHGKTTFERGSFKLDFPAFHVEGYVVWGLTYRMMCGFLGALDVPLFSDGSGLF